MCNMEICIWNDKSETRILIYVKHTCLIDWGFILFFFVCDFTVFKIHLQIVF